MNPDKLKAELWAIKKLDKLEDYELMAEIEALINRLVLEGQKEVLKDLQRIGKHAFLQSFVDEKLSLLEELK